MSTATSISFQSMQRRRCLVTGRVQGVGFRPFVYRLAHDLSLTGWVRNANHGVVIEVQGSSESIDTFLRELELKHPRLATIKSFSHDRIAVEPRERDFVILPSDAPSVSQAEVCPDLAICPECLAELRDKSDRRRGFYPLINCTQCGPRYSIVQDIPYDRAHTTMKSFVMCPDCHREYDDPIDRRFHAQPTACHQCGPGVRLIDPAGNKLPGDPIEQATRRLLAGQIVAIKGIGGYHLAFRADDPQALIRLRRSKHRPAKPLAMMVPSLEEARRMVRLSQAGIDALTSPAAPIVIAPRRGRIPGLQDVSSGLHRLGVMLPYTPIHHMIFDIARTRLTCVVMTSANDTDEPIVFDDAKVVESLGKMCDAILIHDRPIERPVDDSVLIDNGQTTVMIRRARGYVPDAVDLPVGSGQQGVALGAEMKNTIAVLRDSQAVLSQHLGDLKHVSSFKQFLRTINDHCRLFETTPQWVAHDMHPMYMSTSHARLLSRQLKIPTIPVQHHHAHAASVLAEHGLTGPALAVICDGTGYGTDHTIWGGELLKVDLLGFQRLDHLRPLRLPGGDAAAKQPWRSALSLLFNALGEKFDAHPVCRTLVKDAGHVPFIAGMIRDNRGCVLSSSAGRVFDAVAALLGVCAENLYDAHAPMLLESVAMTADESTRRLPRLEGLDVSPLILHLLNERQRGVAVGVLARQFHLGFARMWSDAVLRASQTTRLRTVVLSGGVMCNTLLLDMLVEMLQRHGLNVLRNVKVPANDGGIALGQCAVAAARFERGFVASDG